HAPARPDLDRDRRLRVGAALGRAERGHPAGGRDLVPARRKALARSHGHHGPDAHRHPGKARRQGRRVDGARQRRAVQRGIAGNCKHISVKLHVDGSVSVIDDGRGIPVQVKAETGRSTLEEALTVAGSSGKFDNAAYRVSAGLHGMGAKAMNALSEWCEAEVRRDGRVYKMEFERGYKSSELQNLGPAPDGKTGTSITFKPDPEVFGELGFDYETLATRFRQI